MTIMQPPCSLAHDLQTIPHALHMTYTRPHGHGINHSTQSSQRRPLRCTTTRREQRVFPGAKNIEEFAHDSSMALGVSTINEITDENCLEKLGGYVMCFWDYFSMLIEPPGELSGNWEVAGKDI